MPHEHEPAKPMSAPAEDAATDHATAASVTTRRPVNKSLVITLAILILLIAGAWFGRGLFFAAMVDGQPISRWGVLKELENRSGADAVNTRITEIVIVQEAIRRDITVTAEEINEEIRRIEEQLAAQETTLDEALAMQGLTREDIIRQISIQKHLEKLLGDKIVISDEEVEAYITENGITLTEGSEEDDRGSIKDMIKNQKMSAEVPALVDELRAQADITYFGTYARP